ncbi:hypothetical protein PTKIN_Ptkin15bG0118000 [Pterospermum kingtungense]
MAEALQRYAVVTGANKGIGLEICKQLASEGIMLDDVSDPASITSLADFLKNRFGKLDILVNNASVRGGNNVNYDALKAASISGHEVIN